MRQEAGAGAPAESQAAIEEDAHEGLGPLLVLTPTELEVLEVAHLSGLVEHRPQAGEGEDRSAVWVEAIRSLTARGLLGPDGRIETATTAGELAQTVLDVRLGADAVVVVERLLQVEDTDLAAARPEPRPEPRRDLRLLHLLPFGAVVEDVHAEGLHGFDLVLDPEHLVPAVTDTVVPPDAVEGERQDDQPVVIEVDPDRADLLSGLLGHPTVLAELTLATGDGRGEGHLVALGPGGCWAAPRGPGPLTFVAVPPNWVARTVTDWVATVLASGG